jgi:Zn-dependent protease
VLVYAAELATLAREAQALEARGELTHARVVWSRALNLLPPDAKQAAWVRERLQSLTVAEASAEEQQAKSSQAWVRWLGPLAPVAVVLAKGKGLLLAVFKLKFLLSFFSFIGVYVMLWGWKFGVGFAVCILIHELGHYVDIKRRGLPAEMPVFFPGIGAYVQWNARGVTKRQIAQISLAGPLAGFLASAGCYAMFLQTHLPVWAALAHTSAWLNILNLIPVWTLDGSQAFIALGVVERVGMLATALAMWAYTGENMFLFVVGGIVYRLFTKDKPAEDDWGTWFYFVAVMAGLAWILHLTPLPAR